MGGWNGYVYPLDPVQFIDPLGLNACDLAPEPTALCGNPLFTGGMGPNKMLNELGPKGGFNGSGTMLGTGVIGGGIVGATKGQVDNAGRSVNPLADILTQEHKSGVNPGGNCTPDELDKLQKQKDAFCNMPRSCSKNDSKFDLINKMNINLACAHTRKNINNKCFFGGDKTHMDQENDAFKSSVNCRGLLNGIK